SVYVKVWQTAFYLCFLLRYNGLNMIYYRLHCLYIKYISKQMQIIWGETTTFKDQSRRIISPDALVSDSRNAEQTQLFMGTLATRTNEGVLNELLKSYSAGKPSAVMQHGALLLYILLPDVDSTDLHKETNVVVTLADCESDQGYQFEKGCVPFVAQDEKFAMQEVCETRMPIRISFLSLSLSLSYSSPPPSLSLSLSLSPSLFRYSSWLFLILIYLTFPGQFYVGNSS
ncbi:hypothetical protein ALC62_04419, partial [Cyphomyrmex costatus]